MAARRSRLAKICARSGSSRTTSRRALSPTLSPTSLTAEASRPLCRSRG
jgi:hypothetical protein